MPELPEVETTRRGIEPACLGQTITKVVIRQRSLRWPVPKGVEQKLKGAIFQKVGRRAKYLLLDIKRNTLRNNQATLIVHLGMTGTFRVLEQDTPAEKHDHIDILLDNNTLLRFRDPRRFGAFILTTEPSQQHPLLKNLGIEPVLFGHTADDVAEHLYTQSRKRKISIKTFLMDQKIITGVGNIYACESLFLSGIHPKRACNKISKQRYLSLAKAIISTLTTSIKQGGTTLQDFRNSEGKPGYFQQQLLVYGRENKPCTECGTSIKKIIQNQRSTWYCPHCQH